MCKSLQKTVKAQSNNQDYHQSPNVHVLHMLIKQSTASLISVQSVWSVTFVYVICWTTKASQRPHLTALYIFACSTCTIHVLSGHVHFLGMHTLTVQLMMYAHNWSAHGTKMKLTEPVLALYGKYGPKLHVIVPTVNTVRNFEMFHAVHENIARVEGCIFTSLKDEWKYCMKCYT